MISRHSEVLESFSCFGGILDGSNNENFIMQKRSLLWRASSVLLDQGDEDESLEIIGKQPFTGTIEVVYNDTIGSDRNLSCYSTCPYNLLA